MTSIKGGGLHQLSPPPPPPPFDVGIVAIIVTVRGMVGASGLL